MPHISFQNSKIYYEVHGKGEPLLYIHGWNGCMDSFKFNLLDRLKKKYQIILFDLPGYGDSQEIKLSFEILCKLVTKLLDALKIEKVNLLGFCMGAIVSLDYTIRNQERVKKLILIETYIDFPFIIWPLVLRGINKPLIRFFRFNKLGISLTKNHLFMKNKKYRTEFFELFQKAEFLF